jgi:hypothetical protein
MVTNRETVTGGSSSGWPLGVCARVRSIVQPEKTLPPAIRLLPEQSRSEGCQLFLTGRGPGPAMTRQAARNQLCPGMR